MRRRLRTPGSHPNEQGMRPGLIRTRMPPGSVGGYRGPNLIVDGDCEAVGVGDWTAGTYTTLSKDSATPISGLRSLRVELNTADRVAVASQNILTSGVAYRLTGSFRRLAGAGNGRIKEQGGNTLWTADAADGVQEFDISFTASVTANISLQGLALSVGEYDDWDDLYLSEE